MHEEQTTRSPAAQAHDVAGVEIIAQTQNLLGEKGCSADLKRRARTQGKVRSPQQPQQHSCTENSSQMHQHDSSVLLSEWKALLVHSGGWGFVKCSRTAAWRVPLPLINNSDNMIYATHFAHKITGCNCLPDVFGACCSFLSASW